MCLFVALMPRVTIGDVKGQKIHKSVSKLFTDSVYTHTHLARRHLKFVVRLPT